MTNTKPTDKRARLRKAAQDYQSSLSWYQENLDSPNAEQDCDESTAAFKREIGYRETDIIADLLDEIDELQEYRKRETSRLSVKLPAINDYTTAHEIEMRDRCAFAIRVAGGTVEATEVTNNKQCGICAACVPQIDGGSGFINCEEAHAAQLAEDRRYMSQGDE